MYIVYVRMLCVCLESQRHFTYMYVYTCTLCMYVCCVYVWKVKGILLTCMYIHVHCVCTYVVCMFGKSKAFYLHVCIYMYMHVFV